MASRGAVAQDHKGVIVGKHTDKLGTFDSFRAPWETEAGEDAEIDKSKLKRLIFNMKLGEAKALDSADESKDKIAEAEKAVAEANERAEKASPDEANREIAKLKQDNAALKAAKEKLEAQKAEDDLRAEVLAGIDPTVAKYVKGSTKEELEKSLEEVKADFGIKDEPKDDDDDDDGDDEPPVRSTPRTRLSNPLGGGDFQSEKEIDYDKVADAIISGGNVFR